MKPISLSIEHLCLPPSGTSRFSCCAGGIGGMGASAPIESSVERSCAWRTQLDSDKVWGADFGRIQFGASWHNFQDQGHEKSQLPLSQ